MKSTKAIKALLIFNLGQALATVNLDSYENAFRSYMSDFESIEGWFEKPFVKILHAIDDFQVNNKISGNLGEIGVYHGKSYVPLYLLSKQNELVLAVDCFDDQQYNYDLSGMGCRYDRFLANLKKYSQSDLSKYRVLKCDSSKIKPADFFKATNNNKFRLFSIDGCHRAKETMIDLQNTYQILQRGGVVVIDDYFNKDWPGVAEGVSRFLISNNAMKPFFIGWNKMLLTHAEFVPAYSALLKSVLKPKKDAQIFGSTVLIYE